MAIKTYRAKNLYEAFAMIQEDLGRNAVVLETREIRKSRFFGLFFGDALLEVVATDEIDEISEINRTKENPGNLRKSLNSDFSRNSSVMASGMKAEILSACSKQPQTEVEPEFWKTIPTQEVQLKSELKPELKPEPKPELKSELGPEPFNALDFMTFYGEQMESVSGVEPEITSGVASAITPNYISEADSVPVPTVQSSNFRKRQRFSDVDEISVTSATSAQKTFSKNRFSSNESSSALHSDLLFGCGNGFFDQIANLSHSGPTGISAEFRDALLQIYAKLQTADMDECSIKELMTRLREDTLLYAATGKRKLNTDLEFLEQKLQELVAQEIQTSGPIPISRGKRHAVALVGPTGVGKTTTIAKLAIDYRQKKNCQVGLITLDLSRMGAVEQLQTFADVIGIPMLCASTRRQMRDAMSRMADFDLVLIDTAGQSRAGDMSLQEMRILFDVADVEDVMLVLSSTTRTRILQQAVDAFSSLGITSLILTKLDESLGLGNLFPLLQTVTMPVSYLTNGQKVPDDFETADRMRLARYILGDEQTVAR
ncbi:MAG: hypothetical protein Q4C70_03700 [Planctomycetia bacterium]|nr:hypothetical protein [Planctomycetia bacterium]